MTIRELRADLRILQNQDKEILIASDEELNTLFQKFEVSYFVDIKKYVIFGYSGSEMDQI